MFVGAQVIHEVVPVVAPALVGPLLGVASAVVVVDDDLALATVLVFVTSGIVAVSANAAVSAIVAASSNASCSATPVVLVEGDLRPAAGQLERRPVGVLLPVGQREAHVPRSPVAGDVDDVLARVEPADHAGRVVPHGGVDVVVLADVVRQDVDVGVGFGPPDLEQDQVGVELRVAGTDARLLRTVGAVDRDRPRRLQVGLHHHHDPGAFLDVEVVLAEGRADVVPADVVVGDALVGQPARGDGVGFQLRRRPALVRVGVVPGRAGRPLFHVEEGDGHRRGVVAADAVGDPDRERVARLVGLEVVLDAALGPDLARGRVDGEGRGVAALEGVGERVVVGVRGRDRGPDGRAGVRVLVHVERVAVLGELGRDVDGVAEHAQLQVLAHVDVARRAVRPLDVVVHHVPALKPAGVVEQEAVVVGLLVAHDVPGAVALHAQHVAHIRCQRDARAGPEVEAVVARLHPHRPGEGAHLVPRETLGVPPLVDGDLGNSGVSGQFHGEEHQLDAGQLVALRMRAGAEGLEDAVVVQVGVVGELVVLRGVAEREDGRLAAGRAEARGRPGRVAGAAGGAHLDLVGRAARQPGDAGGGTRHVLRAVGPGGAVGAVAHVVAGDGLIDRGEGRAPFSRQARRAGRVAVDPGSGRRVGAGAGPAIAVKPDEVRNLGYCPVARAGPRTHPGRVEDRPSPLAFRVLVVGSGAPHAVGEPSEAVDEHHVVRVGGQVDAGRCPSVQAVGGQGGRPGEHGDLSARIAAALGPDGHRGQIVRVVGFTEADIEARQHVAVAVAAGPELLGDVERAEGRVGALGLARVGHQRARVGVSVVVAADLDLDSIGRVLPSADTGPTPLAGIVAYRPARGPSRILVVAGCDHQLVDSAAVAVDEQHVGRVGA